MRCRFKNLEFASAKDGISYIRSKLDEIGFCEITTNHKDFEFMSEIAKGNACDFQDIYVFKIQPNVLQKNAKHITFKRKDGSEQSLSWRRYFLKNKSNNVKIKQMFRSCIHDTMFQYKFNKCCENCGSTTNLHVHHSVVGFDEIVNMFLVKHPCDENVKTKKDIRTGITYFDDEEYISEFIQYHNSTCFEKLKVLCQPCHIIEHRR